MHIVSVSMIVPVKQPVGGLNEVIESEVGKNLTGVMYRATWADTCQIIEQLIFHNYQVKQNSIKRFTFGCGIIDDQSDKNSFKTAAFK